MTAVVLDCDPGHDDALAIMLAAAHPAVDLLAISTVGGNQTLGKTTLNARRVCDVAGSTGTPIVSGLPGTGIVADDVHGESGLDVTTKRLHRRQLPPGRRPRHPARPHLRHLPRRLGLPPAPPLHDPVAVAHVIESSIVPVVHTRLDSELAGTFTRGATVADLHRRTGRPPNAHVATGIDTARCWDLMIGATNRLPLARTV